MESTQERALNGLVELWADVYSTEIYSIQGKRFTAFQLKPYVKAALAEPDSSIHRIIESDANKADACIKYGRVSARVHHNRIMQNLIREELRYNELLYFFDRAFYLAAILYISFEITFAEAEKRIKQSFECALSCITLRQLLNKPSGNDIPSEFRLHTWLSSVPLPPASIAGANVRLRRVLEQRFKTFSRDMRYYEQDAKTALWECWKGKHVDEAMKMLSKQGDPTERMATLQRIMDGQEPELLRTMMLSMLRKTIEDLPDISEQLQEKRRTYDRAKKIEAEERRLQGTNAVRDTLLSPVRMTEEVSATVPSKHDDLVEPTPADLLKQIGISRDNTSEAEWQVFMMFSQKILNGELEVGSKTGLSISAALGKDAPKVRKIISRYRERQLNL